MVFVFKWEPPIINVSSVQESRLSRQNLQVFLSKPLIEIVRAFRFNLVKIIPLKSDNCALTLWKRLFCNAKPTLLPCKTATFGTQNNRFCNALIINHLHNRYTCEKYLHYHRLFFAYATSFVSKAEQASKQFFVFGKAGLKQ